MLYLIDGNNLAGKLHLLGTSGFDQALIDTVKQYLNIKNQRAILVFDSNDPLGDRYKEDNITVIYTPKDAVYANADDKIIELMKSEKEPQDWIVVSDDMRIIDEAGKLDIEVVLARDFAKKLVPEAEVLDEDEDELSKFERDEITDELMNEWDT